MNISNTINGPGIGGGSILNTPKQSAENSGGFWSALAAACAEKPGDSEMLFPSERTELTDGDIAELAARYDPGNMTGEEYRKFLSDLEFRGAITHADHRRMTSYYMDGAAADISGDLQMKLKYMPAASRDDLERRGLLSGIVDRMNVARNGRSLLEEAADSSGQFWAGLRQTIIETARENEELRKEDETIEMLTLMLDSMTGRNDPRVSVTTGVKLAMNADQDIIRAGYLPTELHAYLLATGGKAAYEMVEEPEEKDGKVQKLEEANTEKLYAGNEKRHGLMEDTLADLAGKYNPNNMSREQYDSFLEDLVNLGVASWDMIERLGYQGMTEFQTDETIPFVCEIPGALNFSRSPIDSDIEGWIKNRMLWKPGITRESAKRAGLTLQYDRIMEEEKTLSRISEILADVKRQRYPGVTL